MKKKNSTFTCLTLILLTASIGGQKKCEAAPQSYWESSYYRQGIIPYEKCYLGDDENDYKSHMHQGGVAFGVGITQGTMADISYLICTMKNPEYLIKIPVRRSDNIYFGPIIHLSDLVTSRVRMHHLDRKKVSDLFGVYRGISLGASLGFGGKISYLRNNKSVGMKILDADIISAGLVLASQLVQITPLTELERQKLPSRMKQFAEEMKDFEFLKITPDHNGRDLKSWIKRKGRKPYEKI